MLLALQELKALRGLLGPLVQLVLKVFKGFRAFRGFRVLLVQLELKDQLGLTGPSGQLGPRDHKALLAPMEQTAL